MLHFFVSRHYSLHEAVQMILEDDDVLQADVYISPPNDGLESAEDSGDENSATVDNMTGSQLSAPAEIVSMHADGHTHRIDGDDTGSADVSSSSDDETPPQPPKKKCAAPKRVRQWKEDEDIPTGLATQQPWPDITPPKFLSEFQTPTSLFEMFFDDDVLQFIVDRTVQYARRDKLQHSFVTNVDEIRTLFAILLISGYNYLPRRTMYWEVSPDCHNEAISSAMSRNRFDELMRYLHLADNLKLDSSDRFAKVRPLYNMLNERCLTFRPIEQYMSVDETMIPYFGRHPTKQFIRSKPVRFGYKLWSLATSGGYVIQFEPYGGGAKDKSQEQLDFGLGGSVILDLISELPQALPFQVTFDNFFTSVKLLDHLGARGLGAIGTIRQNRLEDCPLKKCHSLEKASRGSVKYALDQSSNVVVVAWRDNKVVTLASNSVGIEPAGCTSRWSREKRQRITVNQPRIVKVYNNTMGGVDRADQNVSAYRITMRTKKWWWPLFAYTLDLVIQNGWLLYRKTPSWQQRQLDLLAFRRDVVRVYLMRHAQPARMGRPGRPQSLSRRVPQEVRLDNRGHFFADSPTQRRCANCGKNTRKHCTKCDVGMHIHCFNAFHGVA